MFRIKRLVATALLGAFAIGLAAGCMESATAPEQTTPAMSGRTAASSDLLGTVGGAVTGLLKLVFKVLNVVGSVGGSLSNGRWRVDIPAGAFDGAATVGVGVRGSDAPRVELEITPADKNNFRTPVRLSVNCSSVPTWELRNYVIFWFNPATRTWDEVPGSSVDLNRKTVSAPLQHFSSYAVGPKGGKAGW